VSISVNQWPTSRLGGEARYTYSPDYIDAAAVQERDLNADDDFGDDDEVVYYLSNTLYSVYALVDADENVIERYRYDAYGACTVLDADGSADSDGISDVSNAYAFTGRRLDTESGLMQYRNRYYTPAFGRFVSRDPAGYVDGSNFYRCMQGNPLAQCDPCGLDTIGPIGPWPWDPKPEPSPEPSPEPPTPKPDPLEPDHYIYKEGTISFSLEDYGNTPDLPKNERVKYKLKMLAWCKEETKSLEHGNARVTYKNWLGHWDDPPIRFMRGSDMLLDADTHWTIPYDECPDGYEGVVGYFTVTLGVTHHEWCSVGIGPFGISVPLDRRTEVAREVVWSGSVWCCWPCEAEE